MGGKDHIGEANERLDEKWKTIHAHTTGQEAVRGFMRSPRETLMLARVKKALKDAQGSKSLSRLKMVEGLMDEYLGKYAS